MSEILCSAEWRGADGKDHTCELPKGHDHKCVCDCGDRARVVNQLKSYAIKPFYKRRKSTT